MITSVNHNQKKQGPSFGLDIKGIKQIAEAMKLPENMGLKNIGNIHFIPPRKTYNSAQKGVTITEINPLLNEANKLFLNKSYQNKADWINRGKIQEPEQGLYIITKRKKPSFLGGIINLIKPPQKIETEKQLNNIFMETI